MAAPAWADIVEDPSGGLALLPPQAGIWRLVTSLGRSVTATVAEGPGPIIVPGPWTVRFVAGPGAPQSITLAALTSWTEHPSPAVKYFSGTAAYEKEIDLPSTLLGPSRKLELDLGDVRELAELFLNGRSLGIVWKLPRTVDITAAAHAGTNQLRIEVTNLWPNRLIGDQFLPEGQRYTKTNIRKFTTDSSLMPSGLLGPVTLRVTERMPLDSPSGR